MGNEVVRDGYKVTEVGGIPVDWDIKKIKEIADVKTGPFGSLLHESDYVFNGTPIITVEHLGERGVNHVNLPQVSDHDKKRLKSFSLQTNDIVFSRVGSVDRNALIKETENDWLFSGRLLRIRIRNREVYPQFLSYYFHYEPTKERIRSVAVGQTMPSLNTEILSNVKVPLPPLDEQEKIAGVLSDVDSAIASLDKLITKKRNLKHGAMQSLLSGKQRLPGFSGEWEVKPLGCLVDKIIGGGTPRREKAEYWNGKIFWATVKDFTSFCPYQTQERITVEGLNSSASNLIPKGTLILCTRMAVGKAVIYDVDVAINQDLKAIFFKSDVDTKFMLYCFLYYSLVIESWGSGSTVKGINLEDLKKIIFPYISLSEQKAIAQILTDMDVEIETLEKRRDKYQAIKQGMMQELLTGKIRLK